MAILPLRGPDRPGFAEQLGMYADFMVPCACRATHETRDYQPRLFTRMLVGRKQPVLMW